MTLHNPIDLSTPYLVSFPGPSFSFNRDSEKLGLVHTVCACAELRATRSLWREKGVCDLPVLFQGEGGTQYCYIYISKHNKYVLEAVFLL